MPHTVRRYDAGTLLGMYKTPEGFYKGIARVTRTGVFTYRNADGTLRKELRHPDEVFKKDSMDSLKMVPITNNHPPDKLVNKDTAKELTIGYTGENVIPDGKFVMVPIAITSADGVKAIEAGRRDLSCGYEVELDGKPGHYDSEEYTDIQQNIRYNHVAIVDRGRAGADVRLNMDADDAVEIVNDFNPNHDPSSGRFSSGGGGGGSGGSGGESGGRPDFTEKEKKEGWSGYIKFQNGKLSPVRNPISVQNKLPEWSGSNTEFSNAIKNNPQGTVYGTVFSFKVDSTDNNPNTPNTRSDAMPKVRLDNGLEYEAPQEVIVAFTAKQVELDGLKKETDKLRADADTAKETQKALQVKVDGLPAAITAGVKARLSLEKIANDTLDEETVKKLDSMSDAEIRSAVILSKFPEAKLDGKSEEYLNARFDAAVEAIKTDGTNVDQIAAQREKMGKRGDSAANADCSAEKKRKAMIDGMTEAYKDGNISNGKK
jgi:hypothetical protein